MAHQLLSNISRYYIHDVYTQECALGAAEATLWCAHYLPLFLAADIARCPGHSPRASPGSEPMSCASVAGSNSTMTSRRCSFVNIQQRTLRQAASMNTQ